jgi:hypothetical protein
MVPFVQNSHPAGHARHRRLFATQKATAGIADDTAVTEALPA